jgi:hypothetical protein
MRKPALPDGAQPLLQLKLELKQAPAPPGIVGQPLKSRTRNPFPRSQSLLALFCRTRDHFRRLTIYEKSNHPSMGCSPPQNGVETLPRLKSTFLAVRFNVLTAPPGAPAE